MIVVLLMMTLIHSVLTAMSDTLCFRFKKSIFRDWDPEIWYPNISFKNKFREKTEKSGAKFFGALDVLSFFTEGFGYIRFTQMIILALSVFIVSLSIVENSQGAIYKLLMVFPVLYIEWSLIYRLFYYKIFRWRKK